MMAIETLVAFGVVPALIGWAIARWQLRRKLARLRSESAQVTLATLARMKFRHDAGVRGWRTRGRNNRERRLNGGVTG
jgi:hypothetical protein